MAGSDVVDAVLRLGVGSHRPSTSDSSGTAANSRIVEVASPKISHNHGLQQQQQQQITIVYDGRVCACDVTEIQARTIISLAKQEMGKLQQHREKPSPPDQTPPSQSPVTVTAVPQLVSPRLSMKRSLQRFLQKRKARISVASPYQQFTKECSKH